jgi:hypothetical protein
MTGRSRPTTSLQNHVLQAAIGLATMYFPTAAPEEGLRATTRDDILWLLDGHLELWGRWRHLPEAEALRFARLLRHRPNRLADPKHAAEVLGGLLASGSLAGCVPDESYEQTGLILVEPSMPPPLYVDTTLAGLDLIRAEQRRCLPAAEPGRHHALARVDGARGGNPNERVFALHQYDLLSHHQEATGTTYPVLTDAPERNRLRVPFDALRDVAEAVDAGLGGTHRADSVTRFQRKVRDREGRAVTGLDLEAGTLNSLLAYTGFGKSVVLIEVFACWALREEVTVGFVLPNNADVMAGYRRIVAAAKHVKGVPHPANVVPLMSPNSLISVAGDTATGDDEPASAWDTLGYGCGLAATAVEQQEVDSWQPGREPCWKLRRPSPGKRDLTFACPWRSTCGKFRWVRAATQADVIITSHANLLMGKTHTPIDDGSGLTDRTTVEELLLRRCQVLVVDELDSFQQAALARAGRGLVLDRGGTIDTPLRNFDAEFGTAFGRLHSEVDESVRDSLFMLRYHAENYVSHLSYERLGETKDRKHPPGLTRYWRIPRRSDNWLTARLFGVEDHTEVTKAQLRMFLSLFPGGEGLISPAHEPVEFRRIRTLLREVVTAGAAGRRIGEVRSDLDKVLGTAVRISDVDRPKVIDRMLRRAILEQIRSALHTLQVSSGQLIDAGVESAEKIADALGGYSRWQAAPTGPLNRLVFAFREHRDPSGQTPFQLSAAAFGGDPHSYVVNLGDITALAAAGRRRIVLGLSATSFFPLAPHHHVHVRPRWWVADDGTGPVRIEAAGIERGTGAWERISGKTGTARTRAAKIVAQDLWMRHLDEELKRLRRESSERATVLLATTSYRSGRDIADGLLQAGVSAADVCLAIPPGDAQEAPGVLDAPDGSLRLLPANRLDHFPATGARILVAPLARVQRGVNIVDAEGRSTLGSIWLVVRPIPLIDEPAELVAHIQSLAHLRHDLPAAVPWNVLRLRRKEAGELLESIVRCPPYFRSQPREVQLGVAAEIVNGAIQLLGRARRGGTSATLHLVDGAFLDAGAGTDFASLIRGLRAEWRDLGVLDDMTDYHGSALQAFFDYADRRASLDPMC